MVLRMTSSFRMQVVMITFGLLPWLASRAAQARMTGLQRRAEREAMSSTRRWPIDLLAKIQAGIGRRLRPSEVRWLIEIVDQKHRQLGRPRDRHVAQERRHASATSRLRLRNRLGVGRNQSIANVVGLIGIGRQLRVQYVGLPRRRQLQLDSLVEELDDRIAAHDRNATVASVIVEAHCIGNCLSARVDFLNSDDVSLSRLDYADGAGDWLDRHNAAERDTIGHHTERIVRLGYCGDTPRRIAPRDLARG
jgi:hypothetical protein